MRWKYAGTSRDGNGKVISGSTIVVTLADTSTIASIYTTSISTPAVNYVTSSTDGTFVFYIDNSDYDIDQLFDISVSKSGYTTKVYEDVVIVRMTIYQGSSSGASKPTTAVRSDLYYYTDPSSGGFIGEVCTASGTPGTWKTFGVIS